MASTATNLLYDNAHDNNLLITSNNDNNFNPKLSSSDSESSCDEDENGAVRDNGTLQVAHSSSKQSGMYV